MRIVKRMRCYCSRVGTFACTRIIHVISLGRLDFFICTRGRGWDGSGRDESLLDEKEVEDSSEQDEM
jgi:hypothetical protein